MSIEYDLFCKTGIIANIKGAPGKTVLLRADMDALPIEEQNQLPYTSKAKNVMHACGHDGHIAMLLGAAKLLTSMPSPLSGTVKLVFQPVEVTGEITKTDSFRSILEDVDTAFAIHVDPALPPGKISVDSGPRMAGVDDFTISIRGKGGHGATPHLVSDALLAGAHLAVNLHEIVSREMNPLNPVVVSIGIFQSGTKANVLPSRAYLAGNIRFYDPDLRNQFPQILDRIATHTAKAFRTEASVIYTPSLLPIINDSYCCDIARQAAIKVVGGNGIVKRAMSTTSDDFCRYLENIPGVYAFLGTGGTAETSYPLHHEKFNLDENALLNGTQLYVEYALEYLISQKW